MCSDADVFKAGLDGFSGGGGAAGGGFAELDAAA